MSKEKYKVIKVLIEETYLIEMHDEVISQVNGWTLKEIISEWFKRFPARQHHASRDTRLANRKFLSTTIEDL